MDSREKNLRWDTEAQGEERARARGAGGLEAPPPSLLAGGHHTPLAQGRLRGCPLLCPSLADRRAEASGTAGAAGEEQGAPSRRGCQRGLRCGRTAAPPARASVRTPAAVPAPSPAGLPRDLTKRCGGRFLRRQHLRDCGSVLRAQRRSETSGTSQSRAHAAQERDPAARVLEAETPFNNGAGTVTLRPKSKALETDSNLTHKSNTDSSGNSEF